MVHVHIRFGSHMQTGRQIPNMYVHISVLYVYFWYEESKEESTKKYPSFIKKVNFSSFKFHFRHNWMNRSKKINMLISTRLDILIFSIALLDISFIQPFIHSFIYPPVITSSSKVFSGNVNLLYDVTTIDGSSKVNFLLSFLYHSLLHFNRNVFRSSKGNFIVNWFFGKPP